MATMAFNRFFREEMDKDPTIPKMRYHWYTVAINKGAMFDCRTFNIPKEEVANLIYWRQLDAIRNSVQMVGQANFSHKELQGKTCENIKEMLIAEKGINWENYPVHLQRGSACRKGENGWEIDYDMPIIKFNRDYIEKLIYFD